MAGAAKGPSLARRSATSRRASSAFGPYGVVRLNAVRSALVVAASDGRHEPVGRARRGAVEEEVLVAGQPWIDVDEAVHPDDAWVGREAARVVVQRGHVGRRRRRTGRPDRQGQRREPARPELRVEPVERRPGWHVGRQDRGVRSVEPDVQERGTEQEQEPEGRDEHRHRMAHHPPGEPGPWPVHVLGGVDLADPTGVDPIAEDAQDRRQEGQRRGHREADHDGAGDPHRAQDRELEQDQSGQPEQDGEAREEDRPAGGHDGHRDGLGNGISRRHRPSLAGARAPRGTGWS